MLSNEFSIFWTAFARSGHGYIGFEEQAVFQALLATANFWAPRLL
jgi:hypothetical protein